MSSQRGRSNMAARAALVLSMPTKTCRKCGSDGPFYKQKRNPDGLDYFCRECRKAYLRNYWDNGPVKPRHEGPHKCPRCGSLGPFPASKNGVNGFRNICKECVRKQDHEQHVKNRAAIIERQRQYYHSHKAESVLRHKMWRKENPQKTREYNQRYATAHPEKTRDANRKYRANKMAAEGSFTEEQFRDLKNLYGNRCLCCGRQEPDIRLHADHVVPLSRGGSNDISNIQPLCRLCNSRKHVVTCDYRPSDRQPLISVVAT